MSGLEIPGLVFGVVPVVFNAAIEAWKVLDDTVSFVDDTEDLGIRLETVKAHLGIWAARSGLTDGKLDEVLVPFEELIARTLNRICDLVTEAKQKGDKYGLSVVEEKEASKGNAAIFQMRRSLHLITSKSRASQSKIAAGLEAEAARLSISQHETDPSFSRKVFWAVRDKRKFESLVAMLEKHVHSLQGFLVEQDRRKAQQDGTRLALDLIERLSENHDLSQLTGAFTWDEAYSQIDVSALAQWKISARVPARPYSNNFKTNEDWGLKNIKPEDRNNACFIKRGRIDGEAAYLYEKKDYDTNISDDMKDELRDRIEKLLALLQNPKSQRHLHTLQALGYLDDVDNHCWWIVFRFPIGLMDDLGNGLNKPLCLRMLYSSPYKPPLEDRYRIAKRIVDAFAHLYGSDWMHKGIDSRNIIFSRLASPHTLQTFKSLTTALVQGFNYSRQLTQAQTIDRGKIHSDLEAAIYRHPLYQGDAASGYQIHYDIYSLGLLLFEIALWGPLMDILAAKFRPGKEPPVALTPSMRHFHEREALELKRRIDIRVEHELAYRVGTKYKELVHWCLNLKGPVTAVEFYDMVAVPLDELCS